MRATCSFTRGLYFMVQEPERIKAQIDGVVVRGEAREVTDGFHLADFGKAVDFGARVVRPEHGRGIHGGDIQRRAADSRVCRVSCFQTARGSFWLMCWRTFLIICANASATASICSRRRHFGRAEQHAVVELRIIALQGRPPIIFLSEQRIVDLIRRPAVGASHEFVKERSAEIAAAVFRPDSALSPSFCSAEFAQALLCHRRS